MNTHKIIRYACYVALLLGGLCSGCTSIDHYYADYLADGERIYPGRVDSIQFRPGNGRAVIRAKISTDARVSRLQVTWPQGGKFETVVNPEEIAEFKEMLIPDVAEGTYTFDIRTFDQEGNQSMRSEIFGRVYGHGYVANLNNRIVDRLVRSADSTLLMHWFAESVDSTQIGTLVRYPNLAGDTTEIFVQSGSNSTLLPGINTAGILNYRTMYKPSSLAIDTFYAAYVRLDPRELIQPEREIYPYTNWAIAGFSSEEPNNSRLAIRLIDGRDDSFWIARFSSNATSYPNHWVTIDMGAMRKVDGLFFSQKNGDRKIKDLQIQVSNDNQNWETVTRYTLAAVDRTRQFFDLPESRTFRYLKIIPINGHDAQQQPGLALVGAFQYVY